MGANLRPGCQNRRCPATPRICGRCTGEVTGWSDAEAGAALLEIAFQARKLGGGALLVHGVVRARGVARARVFGGILPQPGRLQPESAPKDEMVCHTRTSLGARAARRDVR